MKIVLKIFDTNEIKKQDQNFIKEEFPSKIKDYVTHENAEGNSKPPTVQTYSNDIVVLVLVNFTVAVEVTLVVVQMLKANFPSGLIFADSFSLSGLFLIFARLPSIEMSLNFNLL